MIGIDQNKICFNVQGILIFLLVKYFVGKNFSRKNSTEAFAFEF